MRASGAAARAPQHLATALTLRALSATLCDAPRREVEAALEAAYQQTVRACGPHRLTAVTLLQLELSRKVPRLARAREVAAALL